MTVSPQVSSMIRGRLGARRSSTIVPSLMAMSPHLRFISRLSARSPLLNTDIASLNAAISSLNARISASVRICEL